MRRISLIGWVALAAVTIVALPAGPSPAEAAPRGFRLRLGVGSAAAAAATPALPRPVEHVAAAAAVPVQPQPEATPALTPVSTGPAPERAKPSQKPVRVAGPWCPPDRIVGAGAGFCEIN